MLTHLHLSYCQWLSWDYILTHILTLTQRVWPKQGIAAAGEQWVTRSCEEWEVWRTDTKRRTWKEKRGSIKRTVHLGVFMHAVSVTIHANKHERLAPRYQCHYLSLLEISAGLFSSWERWFAPKDKSIVFDRFKGATLQFSITLKKSDENNSHQQQRLGYPDF